jgi:hypothetical protein
MAGAAFCRRGGRRFLPRPDHSSRTPEDPVNTRTIAIIALILVVIVILILFL